MKLRNVPNVAQLIVKRNMLGLLELWDTSIHLRQQPAFVTNVATLNSMENDGREMGVRAYWKVLPLNTREL